MDLGSLALFDPETVQQWFVRGGYFALFGLLFACGLGLPLPEDIPLLLGGYFVAQGQMNIWAVAILAWCGIIGGDCALYWLSRKYGLNITKVKFIGSHVTEKRILWAEQKFERYGIWVVAICRMFAGVRGAMVIAAGAIKFNFVKFVIADGLAALVSGGLFVYLGYLAGKAFGSIGEMRQKIKHYEEWVVVGIVVAVVLAVAYFWWRSKRHKTLADAALERVDAVEERANTRRGAPGGTRAPATEPRD